MGDSMKAAQLPSPHSPSQDGRSSERPTAGEGGAKRRMRGRSVPDPADVMPQHQGPSPLAKSHARAMRRQPTDAERALWHLLRDRRLAQSKWRRQVPLGPTIVDFVCFEHRVVVECDGSQHAESVRDAARDAWLAAQGFAVLRFWNHAALKERSTVIDTILARCRLPW
jgi:very-short-patch-repair endonuclease